MTVLYTEGLPPSERSGAFFLGGPCNCSPGIWRKPGVSLWKTKLVTGGQHDAEPPGSVGSRSFLRLHLD